MCGDYSPIAYLILIQLEIATNSYLCYRTAFLLFLHG